MNILILNSGINYSSKSDELVLTEKHFHPCRPFFIENNINPESIKNIRTKGVLEKTKYIRHVLKIMDSLLELNGEIKIEFFRVSFDSGGFPLRPLNYLMNEISLCYKERYKVFKKEFCDNVDTIWLKKTLPMLPADDSIGKWSFGIVSDGRKNDRIINIISQIKAFKIPEYEILICGPAPTENSISEVKILDDSDLYFDTRIPISRKKNRIIEKARYNNLVIMHDRISFSHDWYDKIRDFGNYFDQICLPILDETTKSSRVNDWLKVSHDFTDFQNSESGNLKYTEWDRHIYVDGGFILIKRHLLKEIMLNPYLNWGEMEDVDLSQRLYLDGNSICFYENTFLLTQTHRLIPLKLTRNIFIRLFKPLIRKGLKFIRNRYINKDFNNFLKKKIS
jgi:hypothetical protein